MAKAKKAKRIDRGNPTTDGDDLIDDDDATVATAPKRHTPKAKAKSAPKASSKKATTRKAKKTKTAKPKASSNGRRARSSVEHKAPKAGAKFTATYKGKKHTMTTKNVKGVLTYFVKGKAYKSPSSAAASVIDAGQKNGWTFWGIE